MSMFDLDGIAPKIRALYNTFLGWNATTANNALAAINTNLNAPISGISTGGKRRAVKLTSGVSWTHPASVKDNFVRVTLVGGGGAGGRDSTSGQGGSGGGGGEVLFRVPYILSGASTVISIAAAKTGRSTNGLADNGDDTTFGTLTAQGGGGGGASSAGDTAGVGGGIYGGGGIALQAQSGGELGWRIGGGEGGEGGASSSRPQSGGHGISSGGAAADNCGGGGGSWGIGGNGLGAGGSSCNGTDGGGGGGSRTGTSGKGGAGFILIEWEEADAGGGGGGGGGGTEFSDAELRITDNTDATKKIAFEASGIATGTTRTITMPDADVDLGALATQAQALLKTGGEVSGNITCAGTETFDGRDLSVDGAVLDSIKLGYLGQNLQTGTSYELVLDDAGKVVEMNNGAANAVTIPENASVAFPVNTRIDVFNKGAGQTTIGITSDTLIGNTKIDQNGMVSLWKRAATEWVAIGGVA